MSRSRRAGIPRDEARSRPLYARLLGLQYLRPSGFLCFVFLEGAVALGILLALAELVSWWGVLVLPLSVAAMVKVNDVIAGALTPAPTRPGVRVVRSATRPMTGRASITPPVAGGPQQNRAGRPEQDRQAAHPVSGGTPTSNAPGPLDPSSGDAAATLNAFPASRAWTDGAVPADSAHLWARQSASRRYE